MAKKRTTTTKRERDPVYSRARELIRLSESGESNMTDVARQLRTEFKISDKRHVAGTPPDTSLHLGDKRRAWLKENGGIQPTICAMIDRAMKRNS